MPRRSRITPRDISWRPAFLQALRDGHDISAAAKIAGVGRRTVFDHAQRDEQFALDKADAYKDGTAVFEEELRRRALDGVEQDVYHQGVVVGKVRKYSDVLLLAALKKREPEYRVHNVQVEHSGSVAHRSLDARRVLDADQREMADRLLASISEQREDTGGVE